jgi:hypothetical protein
MKLFTLSAAITIGAAAANSLKPVDKTVAELSECFGNDRENYIHSKIDAVNGYDTSKRDNYHIVYKSINDGGSTFVTVNCRFAPWQDNDHPRDPYNQKEGRFWNRSEAGKYKKYKDDRVALKKWMLRHGGTEKWPAGAGGRYRCGWKKQEDNSVLGWVEHKAIPVCPTYNEEHAAVEFVDTVRVQERITEFEGTQCTDANCLSMSLVWDNTGEPFDLDLYVKTPSGKILSYIWKNVEGGKFDLDMGTLVSNPVENIIFDKQPKSGDYKIYVSAYSGVGEKDFQVLVQEPGKVHKATYNGKIRANESSLWIDTITVV